MARKTLDTWATCSRCGGDIPPESQWGKRGERASGYCPGHVRADGMCGAFARRASYVIERDAEVM